MLGSVLSGAILGFVLDFQPFVHGRDQSFTAEGALGGAVFGLSAGTVYLAPIAAILGGLLSRFVGGHAANVSAMIVGCAIFCIAALLAILTYFNYFGLAM